MPLHKQLQKQLCLENSLVAYVTGRIPEIQATLLAGIDDRLPQTEYTESDGQFQFYFGCVDMDIKRCQVIVADMKHKKQNLQGVILN